jgi:hypothetical protein
MITNEKPTKFEMFKNENPKQATCSPSSLLSFGHIGGLLVLLAYRDMRNLSSQKENS